ncbi:protein-L-isoaspartate(D-aspartate) O-methyltransferase [Corallococcus sp. AB049A]|uniref:Protein-L-isoaspartate O-methyltransferase n=1 Tax=Corallococcus interemptor TaxID=2316720 RepID=A0A3A8QXL7_9BACT|nr:MULTISPECIES: protein-L-isoaspartate(D-aspartate) O-methyltransferase [Corallococcus]RKH50248.1 protein-L-isoaspartate(D-aspartate) O-methyltransferase [Corallococcus sp. AB050B]RKH73307.1 protein-L-isoaspartate(D-aspartate) O-methyltransferase [Corallococcus interemptor]RKI74594.1 protein-L-isoaspartate(D-aspartate) O-methyltransferase [Corallococcus sp. AB049A]
MGDWGRSEYLARQGIRDRRVLAAIANLSRADFVPAGARDAAHQDVPLPIGHGQTISQPYVVALMTEALRLRGCERVLEVGTGSGYQTAVLALLAREVFTVEIVRELARPARRLLHRLGFNNVFYKEGDGSLGWPDAAPFDAIIATAAPEDIPRELLRQLRPGGRMVIPVGGVHETQELLRIRRRQPGMLPQVERLLPVRFVPMTGLGAAPG